MPKAISKCENIRNSPGHLSMKLSGFVLPISIFMMNKTPLHKPPNSRRYWQGEDLVEKIHGWNLPKAPDPWWGGEPPRVYVQTELGRF